MAKKLHYAVTYFFIGIVIVACLFFSGCNPAKRALKHIQKAERIEPTVPPKYCAEKYPSLDSVHERIIVKPGKVITDTVVDTYIDIIRDTVYVNKVKTVTLRTTDTVLTTKYEQVVNRAREALLEAENDSLKQGNAELSTRLKTWRSVACILGILWGLFLVWKFVKSKFKIFG